MPALLELVGELARHLLGPTPVAATDEVQDPHGRHDDTAPPGAREQLVTPMGRHTVERGPPPLEAARVTDHDPPAGPPDPPHQPGPGDAPEPPPDLAEQLAAEQAGVAYWRAVAADRRTEAARVQRRPLVRVAVAVDRRTASLQRAVARRGRAAAAAAGQVAVVAAGLGRRPERRARHADLEAQLAAVASTPEATDPRTVLVVHLGPAPSVALDAPVELVGPSDAAAPPGAARWPAR